MIPSGKTPPAALWAEMLEQLAALSPTCCRLADALRAGFGSDGYGVKLVAAGRDDDTGCAYAIVRQRFGGWRSLSVGLAARLSVCPVVAPGPRPNCYVYRVADAPDALVAWGEWMRGNAPDRWAEFTSQQ